MSENLKELSFSELGKICGGIKVVAEPVYSLNSEEIKILSKIGYDLNKTTNKSNSNYRIRDKHGDIANPTELKALCNAINKLKSEGVTITFKI